MLGDEIADAEADSDHPEQGLGGEIDDALTGTTMTDLKLQIRKLKRELEAIKKNEADASRVLVLENLLEDANRMKGRYENDYLAAHREKLVLQRDLEEIRSGKSMGDGLVVQISCFVFRLTDLQRRGSHCASPAAKRNRRSARRTPQDTCGAGGAVRHRQPRADDRQIRP
jgi:hypothetical protein